MEAQLVRGDTRVVALFGDPVAHSISPLIHNHAFKRLNLPFVYIPVRVPCTSVHTAALALRFPSMTGANVTIPHKQAFVPYCDRISETSQRLGVVNTLYFDKGLLWGTTTDPHGFLRALSWMGHDPAGGNVVILGTGATARTIGITLAGLAPAVDTLTIVGRNSVKVEALAQDIAGSTGYLPRCGALDRPAAEWIRNCSLLINCTPVGMAPDVGRSPLPPDSFHPGMTVFDTIYNPAKTLLLRYAEDAGCRVQNGLRMLLYQALASFELWTGQYAPEDLFDCATLESLVSGRSS